MLTIETSLLTAVVSFAVGVAAGRSARLGEAGTAQRDSAEVPKPIPLLNTPSAAAVILAEVAWMTPRTTYGVVVLHNRGADRVEDVEMTVAARSAEGGLLSSRKVIVGSIPPGGRAAATVDVSHPSPAAFLVTVDSSQG